MHQYLKSDLLVKPLDLQTIIQKKIQHFEEQNIKISFK